MKLSSPIVVTPAVRFEVQHVLAVLGSAFAGALITYWLSQPTQTIIGALSSWSSARPLLINGLAVAIIATLTMAQKSFLTAVSGFAAFVFFAVQVTACAQIQAAFPTLDALEKTVLADLMAGDSPAQIASDVCKDLGGNALTDAICADATIIAVDIINALVDTKVLAQKPAALKTALTVKPQLMAMRPAGATP
jgi:hypothetical protein